MFCLLPSSFFCFPLSLGLFVIMRLVQLPSVTLGWSSCQLRCRFPEILPVFCHFGAFCCTLSGFFIHGLGDGRRASRFQYAQYPDLPHLFSLLHLNQVANFDVVCGFDALLILQSASQLYGTGCQAAGFKESGCP